MTANAITRPDVFASLEARDDPGGYTMCFPNDCTSVTSRSLHALSANEQSINYDWFHNILSSFWLQKIRQFTHYKLLASLWVIHLILNNSRENKCWLLVMGMCMYKNTKTIERYIYSEILCLDKMAGFKKKPRSMIGDLHQCRWWLGCCFRSAPETLRTLRWSWRAYLVPGSTPSLSNRSSLRTHVLLQIYQM